MRTAERVQTGVPGLDEVLGGGLPPGGLYLLKGEPGTGKTTVGLQFVQEGVRRGERCLYLCLAETRGQLAAVAHSYDWSLEGIVIHEMRRRGSEGSAGRYTVFSPTEVELEDISREILDQIERVRPTRLVLDSLSEIRLLAEEPARYRRELLHLSDQIGAGCTGWLLDVEGVAGVQAVADTLASGIVQLEHLSPAYGGERRRLRVRKLRTSRSVGGYHDYVIGGDGVVVYPRLVAAAHRSIHTSAALQSGVKELDALLGGGLDGGTSTVLMGSSGTGKSTIMAQFVAAAAARGDRALIFCFDESPTNLLTRSRCLGIPLAEHVAAGVVDVLAIDPAEFSPGELSQRVRAHVDEGARVVVLDSVDGYLKAMPEERFMAAHLHELLAFLSEKGVATILTHGEQGFLCPSDAPVHISYIADTVILLRFFEAVGEVKLAISVTKKRTGAHERSIRELKLGPGGVGLGPPLQGMQGVLSGTPVCLGVGPRGGDGERCR